MAQDTCFLFAFFKLQYKESSNELRYDSAFLGDSFTYKKKKNMVFVYIYLHVTICALWGYSLRCHFKDLKQFYLGENPVTDLRALEQHRFWAVAQKEERCVSKLYLMLH